MNANTSIKIERQTTTTTAGERTLNAPTVVIAQIAARLEHLRGRLAQTILGRFPDADRICYLRHASSAPQANDVITDLTTSEVFIVENVQAIYGGRSIKHYQMILSKRL